MNRALHRDFAAGSPPLRGIGLALGALVLAPIAACGLLAKGGGAASEPSAPAQAAQGSLPVEMPWDTTAVRDDRNAPVLRVSLFGDESAPRAVPYLYGYPIYPAGDAALGIFKLRADNWAGAQATQVQDEQGVVRRVEQLPKLGCTIEGFEPSPQEFVPVLLRCTLPPPAELGGAERPVLGGLRAGADAKQVVSNDLVRQAFHGDFHGIEGNVEREGEGLFNTEHGQLGFGFERGKLARLTYYFDPPEKRWRAQQLWVQP